MPKMVESGVGRNAPRPSAKIAGGVEPRARLVNAPESFHGEILSNSAVSNYTDSPGVNFLLVLSKQRLEGFQIARRETLQQLHLPRSIPTYWNLGPEVTINFVAGFPIKKRSSVTDTIRRHRGRGTIGCAPSILIGMWRRDIPR